MKVYVLTYKEIVRVFSRKEDALREAANLIFIEVRDNSHIYDAYEINFLIEDQKYEEAIDTFNEQSWLSEGIFILMRELEFPPFYEVLDYVKAMD